MLRNPRAWAALLLLAVAPALGASAPLAAELPSVARIHYDHQNRGKAVATVFFLAVGNDAGAAAVGTAHSVPLDEIAQAGALDFRLGGSKRRVAQTTRFLTEPGRSFREAGATLSDDLHIYALAGKPDGVQLLSPRRSPAQKGERVRVIGIPHQGDRDEEIAAGHVSRIEAERIEVDLDGRVDLRGWGGAPIVSVDTGEVVGVLQAAWPQDDILRVGATPVAAVVAALKRPLEGGAGRAFSAHGTAPVAARPPPPKSRKPALGASRAGKSELHLSIEEPAPEAIVGDANGAFVAGRAVASVGVVRKFDVMFVIDTSGSTVEPSGADVDNDGVVGQRRFGGLGSVFGGGSTDPGDTILAAEIHAAFELLRTLDPRSTRIGVVSFAGDVASSGPGIRIGRTRPPAVTEQPLTTDYERIRAALARVLKRGSDGQTHMAAGVDQATIELLSLDGALSDPRREAEKVVLFFTDGQPTLPFDVAFMSENVRAVLRAAERANKAGIQIHSFAIGPEALDGPIATVEMASLTGGLFTPVRHPADLMSVIDEVNFADIESISVRNLSTGEDARQVTHNPDGLFGALVPLQAGKNRIEVVARTTDGSVAKEVIALRYAPGTPAPPLPTPLVALRNTLLEQRLLELREGTNVAAQRVRKELRVQLEREREKARARAAEQRKELDLEVQNGAGGP